MSVFGIFGLTIFGIIIQSGGGWYLGVPSSDNESAARACFLAAAIYLGFRGVVRLLRGAHDPPRSRRRARRSSSTRRRRGSRRSRPLLTDYFQRASAPTARRTDLSYARSRPHLALRFGRSRSAGRPAGRLSRCPPWTRGCRRCRTCGCRAAARDRRPAARDTDSRRPALAERRRASACSSSGAADVGGGLENCARRRHERRTQRVRAARPLAARAAGARRAYGSGRRRRPRIGGTNGCGSSGGLVRAAPGTLGAPRTRAAAGSSREPAGRSAKAAPAAAAPPAGRRRRRRPSAQVRQVRREATRRRTARGSRRTARSTRTRARSRRGRSCSACSRAPSRCCDATRAA